MDILKKIAGGGESITTEFKECRNKLPKNLFETICAFLNRMGGDIFLGVADDGTITGVDESCVPQLKKDISSHSSYLCAGEFTGAQYSREDLRPR